MVDNYQQRASEAEELAKTARTSEERETLATIAALWRRLAGDSPAPHAQAEARSWND